MLRKLLTLTLVILTVSVAPLSAYADGACKTRTQAGDPLMRYLQNLQGALGTITARASSANACRKEQAGADLEQLMNKFLADYNGVLYFPNYITSVRFYIENILDYETPTAIMRDYDTLNHYRETIEQTYQLVYQSCAQDIVLSSGDLRGYTLSDALKVLLQNHVSVTNYYREVVLGVSDDDRSFVLVGDSAVFRTQMQQFYGHNMQNVCREEDDFFNRIGDAIDRISSLDGVIGDGISQWEDAWNLLNDSDSAEYRALERQVLSAELSRQGISGRGADIILSNLHNYDTTNKEEGISGFMRSIGQRILASAGELEHAYTQLHDALDKATNIQQYVELHDSITTHRDINKEVLADYTAMRATIGQENRTFSQGLSVLISMQANLHRINDNIKKGIPDAETTCNDQDRGAGTCKFR